MKQLTDDGASASQDAVATPPSKAYQLPKKREVYHLPYDENDSHPTYHYHADPSQDRYWQKVSMKAHQILDEELLKRYQLCEKRCCPKPVVFMKLMCANCSIIGDEEMNKAVEKAERAAKRRKQEEHFERLAEAQVQYCNQDHGGPEAFGGDHGAPESPSSSLASKHKKLVLCCDLETGIDELREVPCDAAEDLCEETQMDTQSDED